MKEIVLDFRASATENASRYFDRAKKFKKKIEGAVTAITVTKAKIAVLEQSVAHEEKKNAEKPSRVVVPSRWYHSFRWFRTSSGFLVIGGRDSSTNEAIIKKHTNPGDLVFHTDMAGSPFFVIQSEGKTIDEAAIHETADATCTFSRAWKLGLVAQQVFWVKPEQVTKQANPGEYLTKGAFMIRGKTNYVDNKINLAVGITNEHEVMAGPLTSVEKHCGKYFRVGPGDQKPSSIAKFLAGQFGVDVDTVLRALPGGNCKIIDTKR